MIARGLAGALTAVLLTAPPVAARQPPHHGPHADHTGGHGEKSGVPQSGATRDVSGAAAGHVVSAPAPAAVVLPPSIPPGTDAMPQAAFPDVQGHATHDRRLHTFVLLDRLEGQFGEGAAGFAWGGAGWVGGDIDRVWFRTEGDGARGGVGDAEAHVLYGRAVARWWDVVVGVRQDVQPGAQTWRAVGVQGLAPGFFEVQATAYASDAGQTAARFEVEYDLLLTNRLVVQPVAELNLYGRTNAALGVGTGLSTAEAGVRLRYEIRREFAPYAGVTWARAFGKTAELEDEGGGTGGPRLVAGLRVWF